MSNILPNKHINNIQSYYNAYNTRDLYKGKSFNMAGYGKEQTHYYNDESLQDFIVFEGALLSCTQTHMSDYTNKPELIRDFENGVEVPVGIRNNTYGTFVMAAPAGKGPAYIPNYNEETGELSWTISYEDTDITPMRVKGDGISDIVAKEVTENATVKTKVTIKYGNNQTTTFDIPHMSVDQMYQMFEDLIDHRTEALRPNVLYTVDFYTVVNKGEIPTDRVPWGKYVYYNINNRKILSQDSPESTMVEINLAPWSLSQPKMKDNQNMFQTSVQFFGKPDESGNIPIINGIGTSPFICIYGPESNIIDAGEIHFK